MVSKQLQKVTIDLQSSMALIKSVKTFLERMRSEEGLNSIITDAKELAEKIDATANFEKEQEPRPRKVNRQFSYESKDEAVHSGKDSFKVNFFFAVLDTAISSLKERFQLMDNHSGSFKFLYDISNLGKCLKENDLKYACQRLETVLTDGEDHDVNGGDLYKELQILANMLPPGSLPADALSFINHGITDSSFEIISTSAFNILTIHCRLYRRVVAVALFFMARHGSGRFTSPHFVLLCWLAGEVIQNEVRRYNHLHTSPLRIASPPARVMRSLRQSSHGIGDF
nr:PREDICTED: uncharacterized protein LOC107983214 [Anolis carolinensis]|eukprot:XP_016851220.1 PREDICTED: uncharacterized protein LOC107983214 [Anolis carolinensis]